jgi:hypothetical protein
MFHRQRLPRDPEPDPVALAGKILYTLLGGMTTELVTVLIHHLHVSWS